MRDTPRKPPPWRKIAAALRDYFKPERHIATTQAPPAPVRRLTPGQEGLLVAEFHVEVDRAVNAHKAKAGAGEPADSGVLLADLSRWIDDFVKWKMPEHSAAERQPLVERLRLDLAGLVAAAWWPKPAQTPLPAPALPPTPDGRKTLIHRSPEEQARIDALHRGLGQSLADGLNAAVMLIDEKRGRHSIHCEFYDVHGIPVTINDRKVPYCCRWDCAPVCPIDESYVRIAGRRVEYEEWEDLRKRMRAAWEEGRDRVALERRAAKAKRDADFQAFLARANPPADEDGQLLLPFV